MEDPEGTEHDGPECVQADGAEWPHLAGQLSRRQYDDVEKMGSTTMGEILARVVVSRAGHKRLWERAERERGG